jgi:hypothetical protein
MAAGAEKMQEKRQSALDLDAAEWETKTKKCRINIDRRGSAPGVVVY